MRTGQSCDADSFVRYFRHSLGLCLKRSNRKRDGVRTIIID
ncbi:hypothetical protein HMPREF1548_05977 [Clostridium sp. KLE 1755]|nr:hypothetical protein HMPREF1548_05977 [Clostridium sp. KLE 1755]